MRTEIPMEYDENDRVTWIKGSSPSDWWYENSQAVFGPVHAKQLDSQQRQDRDGQANLYYYDHPRTLAFHWSGNPDEKVEVSFGGDHEEPAWFFDYRTHAEHLDVNVARPTVYQTMIAEFAATCVAWIEKQETV